jgi:hypothetical protein
MPKQQNAVFVETGGIVHPPWRVSRLQQLSRKVLLLHRDRRRGELMNVLTLNLVFSTLIFWIAAKLYVFPRLHVLPARTVLLPILLLHSLRHLGLMFLAPGAIYPGLPREFAYPAAFGDLLAAVLALLALWAVVGEWKAARLLVWLFALEGTIDLINAIALAQLHGAAPFMGPAYWIPAFWVPALLVTHYITFVLLIRNSKTPGQFRVSI